jgi:aspartate/methionine/tyrosine aminotransferase
MYWLLEIDASVRLPSAVDLSDHAVVLFGLSKSFGLAGVRIGWLVSRDRRVHAQLAAWRDYTTICNSAPSEILALIALRAKETILARHRERIERNLAVLDDFFGRLRGLFSWVRPRGGSVCFPRLLGEESSWEFAERIVAQAGIMLLPSRVYGYDDRHFRLGFGRQNDILAKFERFLEQRP